ncbi:ABC transporter substrate-binding protein [Flavobacterium sp. 7A]|uniref:ABC transporter substrate-binding protein n=1 Tax=Flavobacterium sp. 7A TaxID=2940571 RepID=UPI002226981E|nr:ABC transporter substrate-binding protein [Flavobacterium sp. 7A]MCW2119595.1 iron complex transport system substrate-binding protein [Flavobacterium sp. 7A]
MKFSTQLFLSVIIFFTLNGCKKTEKLQNESFSKVKNEIEYATSLAIHPYEGYSVVTIKTPWPNAKKNYTYILKQKSGIIPDSLQKYNIIKVPLQSIVVTSTTIIPYLEMLDVEKRLVGFPHPDYISSAKTRVLIDKGAIKNIGQNEKLNLEMLIEMSPELVVTFGIDNNNPMLDNLSKSGLNVLIQADWMEQSPLGKAEWIKLYGALFGKEKEAKLQFDTIIKNYKNALALVATKKPTATVLCGSMYQDQWYVAKANSWGAQFLKDAKANYLWSDVPGTGSIGLSFEQVLEKAKAANYWIATGAYKTVAEMNAINPHYSQFDAFKTKQIYTFDGKIGPTGGTIYYESAPSRPDLVLKDYIKIFHPELLPNYTFTFAQKLN